MNHRAAPPARHVVAFFAYAGCTVLAIGAALGVAGHDGPIAAALAGYLAMVVTLHLADPLARLRTWSPHNIIIAFWEVYFALGVAVYLVREEVFVNLPGDMTTVMVAGTVMTLSLWFGVLFAALLSRKKRRSSVLANTQATLLARRLEFAAVILICIAYFGLVLMYRSTGFLPILEQNVALARYRFAQLGLGYVLPMTMCSIPAISLLYAAYLAGRSNVVRLSRLRLVALGTVAFLPLTAYGGRFSMLMPLVVLALQWVWSSDRMGRRVLAIAMLPLVVAGAMAMVVYRNVGHGATEAAAFRMTINDLFPETRVFAAALWTVPREGLWAHYLGPVATGLLPGRVARLVGIDKESLFRPIGGEIARGMESIITVQNNLGIRIGILGETYLAFGLFGVVVLGTAVGGLGLYLTLWSRSTEPATLAVVAMATATLCVVMPYGSIFLVTVMTLLVPTLVATHWAKRGAMLDGATVRSELEQRSTAGDTSRSG